MLNHCSFYILLKRGTAFFIHPKMHPCGCVPQNASVYFKNESMFYIHSQRNYETKTQPCCNTFLKISPEVDFCASRVVEECITERSGLQLQSASFPYTWPFQSWTTHLIFVLCIKKQKKCILPRTFLVWLFSRRAGNCLFPHRLLVVKASQRNTDPYHMRLSTCSRQDNQTSRFPPSDTGLLRLVSGPPWFDVCEDVIELIYYQRGTPHEVK